MEQILERKDPRLAAFLSFLIGGGGQLYCGKVNRGILFIIIDLILWFTIFGAIIFGIFAMIDAYNIAKDINFQIDFKEKENEKEIDAKNEKGKLAEKKRIENEISIEYFIDSLKKNHKLYSTEIYSSEEYMKKKNTLISSLASKKIKCSSEDFLASLIPLKEQEILSIDEINKIKILII